MTPSHLCALIAVLGLSGCASLAPVPPPDYYFDKATVAAPDSPPDTGAVLRLIGRFSAAHACPLAADLALTAAHVVDEAPFEPAVPLWPFRFEGGGGEGVVKAEGAVAVVDLGVMRPTRPFTRWFPRAASAPAMGERLWWLAYDWRSRKQVYADRVESGRVSRVVAGHIVLDDEVTAGASGSCALNAAGEVVGIVVWGIHSEDTRESTVVVAVYGDWWHEEEESDAEGR